MPNTLKEPSTLWDGDERPTHTYREKAVANTARGPMYVQFCCAGANIWWEQRRCREWAVTFVVAVVSFFLVFSFPFFWQSEDLQFH